MPIVDEWRRFGRAKATKPQTVVATEGKFGTKGDVQESLQRLQETLLLQRGDSTGAREEEDIRAKRIRANKEVAERKVRATMAGIRAVNVAEWQHVVAR